tara:strand:- start:239 stop:457 length:219 start_codon:yes stop_codon:yes gene_type:complete
VFAEIFATNVMELNLQPEVKREISSLAIQMKSTPPETIEMCLRMHFCLPVPNKWRKDSWITSPVVMEYGGFS